MFFDLMVLTIVTCLFIGNLEWNYLESAWRWDLDRNVVYELPEELVDAPWTERMFEGVYYQFGPRKAFLLENPDAITDQPVVTEQSNSQANIDGAEGSWSADNSSVSDSRPVSRPPLDAGYKVYLKEPIRMASVGFSIIFFIQILFLISLGMKGRKRVLVSLRPLQQLAERAEEWSEVSLQEVALDSQRFHDLEHAIAEFTPSSPEDRLTTGDKELMGMETAINNLLAKMHASYQQQNRFVSDASHELKTPIAVIQGYADLLARWGSQDEAVLSEGIQAIQEEARQMQLLVEQLLFLARGDTGRQALTFEPLDLSELVRDVGDEFAMIDEEHEWDVKADEVVELRGDRAMLKQVMRILCDNAKKYSAPGTRIQLTTAIEDDHAIFTIQDAGEGIPQEDLPMIFDRFYRADPARAKHTGGTGLGLSIADWIVTQHGGYFRVLSRVGLGTRFRIFLPLNAPEPPRLPSNA